MLIASGSTSGAAGSSTTLARYHPLCRVRDECPSYALQDGDALAWGVWGRYYTTRTRRDEAETALKAAYVQSVLKG